MKTPQEKKKQKGFSRFMNPDGGYKRIVSEHKAKHKYDRKRERKYKSRYDESSED